MCEKILKAIKKDIEEATKLFDDAYYEAAESLGEDMLYDERYVSEGEQDEWEDNLSELYENYAHHTNYQASYEAAEAVIDAYNEDDDCECSDDLKEDVLTLLNKTVGF